MSELTQAEYGHSSILDIYRWVHIKGDVLHLLDPATAEPLSLTEPPQWLAADSRLAQGYSALADPTQRHKLLIALGRHKHDSDLGRWGWFERAYAKSDVFAFEESQGWQPEAWKEVIGKLSVRKALGNLPEGLSKSKRFSDRLLRARLDYPDTLDFSYDVEKTPKPIDGLLLEMVNPAQNNSRLAELDFPTRKILQFAAGALREWYIPGKYTHEILKLDVPRSPRVLMTLGAAHGDVPRKFQVLGFTPEVKHLPLSAEDKETARLHAEAMRSGTIDPETLGRIAPND